MALIGHGSKFSRKMDEAVAALLTQPNIDLAAKSIGIASNTMLKWMKRPGTRQAYDTLLTRIRARVPNVALRTTFIVGFPGETDADVDELCAFIRDLDGV